MKNLPLNDRNVLLLVAWMLMASPQYLSACTSLLVTKGASADGSVMITYTADAAGFYPRLIVMPATEYPEGSYLELHATDERPAGKIKQVAKTYHVIGVEWDPEPGFRRDTWLKQGLINELQLAFTESTFGGRPELRNPHGLTSYPMLITLALQRAKTAREAIEVMVALAEEYGYHDTGESFSIADKEEAWVFEIIGTGKLEPQVQWGRPLKVNEPVVWVAKKVPDGEISVHANQARIGEIPDVPDKDHCFYSANIKSFAIEKDYYDPHSGKPFRFDEAYGDIDAKSKRVCEARTWSIFRRAAPSQNFSPDYHRGKPDAEPYPWSIKPDKKLSVADVFALKRDHYEGTEFDMTQGLDAGPFGLPLRWRPLYWKLEGDDDTEYAWERPISTQQTGFSVVTQSRSHLPDMVGGVCWYGVDDSYLTCYFPLYCCITEVPKPFATGSIKEFSWDSAWWVTNLVSNYANLKFDRIAPEIIKTQQTVEASFLKNQHQIESAFINIEGNAETEYVRKVLTDLSVSRGERVFRSWQNLATKIFTKFNDGYIRGDDGTYSREGDPYPDAWLRRVVEERPEQFRVRSKE
jgi:dipeptidase